ncbi:MAG: glycosyltransferase [Ignavibacteriaceae bacterium]|jgi:hypothetical protein
MKILWICSANQGLVENKIDYLRNKWSFLYELKNQLELDESIIIEIFFITGKGIFGYLKSINKFKNVINKEDFDLIHAFYGHAGLFANFQRKYNVVVTYLGSDINILKNRIISQISYFLSDWNIFVSHKLSKKIVKVVKQYSILQFGINLNLFYPMTRKMAREKMGLDINKKYVLFSSSKDNPIKNYELANRVIARLQGIEILTLLKGYSREEINLLINSADVLLSTSLHEGSPQIIKEAMACNIPIVATNVGDIDEVVSDTVGCYLTNFKEENIFNSLVEALNFNKRTQGRERIMKFDISKIAEEIKFIYKNNCA